MKSKTFKSGKSNLWAKIAIKLCLFWSVKNIFLFLMMSCGWWEITIACPVQWPTACSVSLGRWWDLLLFSKVEVSVRLMTVVSVRKESNVPVLMDGHLNGRSHQNYVKYGHHKVGQLYRCRSIKSIQFQQQFRQAASLTRIWKRRWRQLPHNIKTSVNCKPAQNYDNRVHIPLIVADAGGNSSIFFTTDCILVRKCWVNSCTYLLWFMVSMGEIIIVNPLVIFAHITSRKVWWGNSASVAEMAFRHLALKFHCGSLWCCHSCAVESPRAPACCERLELCELTQHSSKEQEKHD